MSKSNEDQYLESLDNGRLLAGKCGGCHHYSFPPRATCEVCGSSNIVLVELSGRGQLHLQNAPEDEESSSEPGPPAARVMLDSGLAVPVVLAGELATPASIEELSDREPVDVFSDRVDADGISFLAFKLTDTSSCLPD